MIQFTSKPETEYERVALFEIDGTEYTIPKKPQASVGLRYLRDLRKSGEQMAVANMLTELLGEEGFDALCEYDELTSEDMEAVITAAQKTVFGDLPQDHLPKKK